MKPFFTAEDFKSSVYLSGGDVAAKANRLLEERGVKANVTTVIETVYGGSDSFAKRHFESTHQALLINIQPIEKPVDVAKLLLRKLIEIGPASYAHDGVKDLIERAKRLLEGER